MKHLTYIFLTMAFVLSVASCNDDEDTWKVYSEWRELNNSWLAEQGLLMENGKRYYDTIRPNYDQGNYVLAHWFNDRTETADNLSPFYTSTVAVKYIGRLYNGEAFDSSYLLTDSIYQTDLSGVISGWTIILQQMHVGDSVEVLIPYQSGYGSSSSGTIKPYSVLDFNIKLVDIPYWEVKP